MKQGTLKRNALKVFKVDEGPRGLSKNYRLLFDLTVKRPTGDIQVRIYRKRHNLDMPGYATTKRLKTSISKPMVNFYWVSPFMLDVLEALHASANESLVGLVRKHFGGIEPAPPVGIKTPHTRMIIDAENPPSFEDFIASGGRIEYVPPFDEKTGLPLNDDEDEEDIANRLNGPFDDMDEEDDIGDIAKRLDVSCLSSYDADALYPEAPATQDDISRLAKGLSREIKRITAAFERMTKRLNERDKK